MNLHVFNTKDLQTFFALTQLAEAEGITDVRFIRTSIANEIASRVKGGRLSMTDSQKAYARQMKSNQVNITKSKLLDKCPECGSILFKGMDMFNGVLTKHIWCKKCTWGKVI